MPRTICVLLLFLIFTGLITTPMSAQVQLIVDDEAVLDELGVDEEQTGKLLAVQMKYKRVESMTALQLSKGVPFQSLSTRQQEELRPRFIFAMKTVDAEAESELAAILTPEQMTRLAQLRIQALGPAGILSGGFNTDLDISDEQLDLLREATTEFRAEFEKVRVPEYKDDSPAEINAIFKTELLAVLKAKMTEAQTLKYEEMTGEPITLPKIAGLR